MKHFDLDVARRALSHWRGDPASLEHLQTSGNDVYRFHDGDTPRILRLTDLDYRSAAENVAEMEFVRHLDAAGVRVSAPIPSRSGALAETLDQCSASVLTWAPGLSMDSASPHWTEPFFREWGRTLGAIHAAAESFDRPGRWDWWEEDLIVHADRLLPADDAAARVEFERVTSTLRALPRRPESYGMAHADHGPQNFRFDPVLGITTFDFGNCCRHWYAMDVVISLSTLRRHLERDRYREWILAGYRELFEIDSEVWAHFDDLLRLRVLYVYLSRLQSFGRAPSPEQCATLEQLRTLVASRISWP